MDGKPFPEARPGMVTVKKEISELASKSKKIDPATKDKVVQDENEGMLLGFDGVHRHEDSFLWRVEFAGGHPDMIVKDADSLV